MLRRAVDQQQLERGEEVAVRGWWRAPGSIRPCGTRRAAGLDGGRARHVDAAQLEPLELAEQTLRDSGVSFCKNSDSWSMSFMARNLPQRFQQTYRPNAWRHLRLPQS